MISCYTVTPDMMMVTEDDYRQRAVYYAMAMVSPDRYFSITSPCSPLTWDDLVDNLGELCADTGVSPCPSEIKEMENEEGGVARNDGPEEDYMGEGGYVGEKEDKREISLLPEDDRKPPAKISSLPEDDCKPPAKVDRAR
jgi:hypothetical protein